MTSLFFLSAILFFIYELRNAFNPDKYEALREDFTSGQIQDSDKRTKLKGCLFLTINLFYFLWCLIGFVFASQFIAFAVLFFIGILQYLIEMAVTKSGFKGKRFSTAIRSIDALICAFVIFDIFMTHFRGDIWGTGFTDGFVRNLLNR